ncbi:MAG: hypothetical protein N3B16_02240 [Candidatus Aminicenantes bacterium]|nr:hypothetical protein [Candidatus Aminicenantes bacterium]
MTRIDSFSSWLSRWRVRMGLPAALIVLIFAHPSPMSLAIGLCICLFGLFLRAWASGHLKKNTSLATSGPYRFSRNPLYLANLALGLGLVVAANSRACWFVFFLYFLAFYPATIFNERKRMARLFPKEYPEYEQKVPLFFPSLRRFFPYNHQKFNLALYFQNKEYRAALAIFGFFLLLLFKWIFWIKP